MDRKADHFVAEWIPLTEFSDSNPTVPDPYQLATVVVRDANTHAELARTTVVAPVSTEMHCDNCHYNNGPGNEGISSSTVEQNILKKHDEENMDEYPPGHRGALMNRRPVLCAECHSSNAIGAPGAGGLPAFPKRCTRSTPTKSPAPSPAATTVIPAPKPNACAMSCRSCLRLTRRPALLATATWNKWRRIPIPG